MYRLKTALNSGVLRVLLVHLVGYEAPVNADVLTVEPAVFTLRRVTR